jgi:hypothetical protein
MNTSMTTSTAAPVSRPRLPSWGNGTALRSPSEAPSARRLATSEEAPSASPPEPTAVVTEPDEEVFTVSRGTGKSPNVQPGVHAPVVTNIRRETGPNPFQPGTERTSYVFHLAISQAVEEGEFLWFAGTSLKSKKLTDILTALKLPLGTSFKKGDVVDRTCQGNVILTDKGYTRLSQVFPAV